MPPILTQALMIDWNLVNEEFANLITEQELIEPKNFKEAWDHPDKEQKKKWREAINKEFKDMNDRNIWTIIKRSNMPPERRCVKNKWIFKI